MAGMSAVENGLPSTPIAIPTSSPINYGTNKVSYPYGYVMGGYPGLTYVNRIDYANDGVNTSLRGNLSNGTEYATSVASQNFGYFAGGAPYISRVERIDFSNDSVNSLRTGDLSSGIEYHAGVANINYGYYCGGWAPGSRSFVFRQDFANDIATTSPKGPLTNTKYEMGASGTQDYGWVFGGNLPGTNSVIERIDYSNDTVTANSRSNMTIHRWNYRATGNQNYGYCFGGETPSNVSSTERLDYSNDTQGTSYKGNMPEARRAAGVTGSQSFGYVAGGYVDTVSTVFRMDFSNDTAAMSSRGNLPAAYGFMTASSFQDNAKPQPLLANTTRSGPAGYGYFGGGLFTSPSDLPSSYLSSIDRIDFANDTSTTLSSALNYSPATRRDMGSVASSTHGYWVAGYFGYGGTSDEASDTTRLDFSNDTGTLVVRGNVAVRRGGLKGVGNSNSGYLIGGEHLPGYYNQKTIVDRIDYSNDSVFTTVGSLDATIGRKNGSAVGNQNFGYYAGGYGINPVGPSTRSWSDIFRIDYSNDTSNAPVRAKLDGERYNIAATGNANFGYFSGGYLLAPPTAYSSIVKYDYANDTTNASPTANLTGGNRLSHMGTGGQNFGYFAGGGTYISSVEKFDYSNDTVDASPKGPLSGGNRGNGGACSAGANGLPN
jgi:hypothetical protein